MIEIKSGQQFEEQVKRADKDLFMILNNRPFKTPYQKEVDKMLQEIYHG